MENVPFQKVSFHGEHLEPAGDRTSRGEAALDRVQVGKFVKHAEPCMVQHLLKKLKQLTWSVVGITTSSTSASESTVALLLRGECFSL